MFKKLVTCFTGFIIYNNTFAAEWKLLTYNDDYFIYVDKTSIKAHLDSSTLDFWYKFTARKNIIEEKTYTGDYGLSYQTLNCHDKTIATKSYVTYQTNGMVKESESSNTPSFSPIVPESIGEAFLDLCTIELRSKAGL
ncbi:surface-adhesin E family protein [Acinetobacter sp. MD2]|uniref:surface-adhesin E family protein n=1 Tax=Acinetobacter sp. MD2 TaxID=2600066 RepID=UPI002D1F739B|nr:surface-adhesin E family protein [Acinetobacter sp. MD2]MEB3767982.1 hypothetical protein [Acinetobacter sp. MD2]